MKCRGPTSIRAGYERHGVRDFYRLHGAHYRNPHEAQVAAALAEVLSAYPAKAGARVLDLACGSGEVTLSLASLGFTNIEGADPHTREAYRARTRREALPLRFEDIEGGALEHRNYDLIVCSYALHLVETSRLPRIVYQLSRSTSHLVVLTPHKRPKIAPSWGFPLVAERRIGNVRVRSCSSSPTSK